MALINEIDSRYSNSNNYNYSKPGAMYGGALYSSNARYTMINNVVFRNNVANVQGIYNTI